MCEPPARACREVQGTLGKEEQTSLEHLVLFDTVTCDPEDSI